MIPSQAPGLDELIQRLEAATDGSPTLNAEIALQTGWRCWQSKHGYWNFDGPDEKHIDSFGVPGPARFDPHTGKKNENYDKPPLEWFYYNADIPDYMGSIDAALTLARNEAEARSILGTIYENMDGRFKYPLGRCILFGCATALRLRHIQITPNLTASNN